MRGSLRRVGTVIAVSALGLGFTAASVPAASAVATNGVSFACFNDPSLPGCTAASFHGYASGAMVHLGAVTVSGTSLADVDQAFSGATADSKGLTTPVVGDNGGLAGTGLQIQPAKSATNRAFGTGAGLKVGLGAPANASADQLNLAGIAEQVAPPNGPATVVSIPSASCPETNGVPQCLRLPSGLAAAGALSSEAAAVYDNQVCPLGQPLSYAFGDAADVSLVDYSQLTSITSALSSALSQLGVTVPTTGQVVQNLGDARTTSETFLSPNGDGTFGLTTEAKQTVAPVSVNLFGVADLELEVVGQLNRNGSANPAQPLSLTAVTTGEGKGAKLSLAANDLVTLTLKVAGQPAATILPPTSIDDLVGQGGLVLQLNPQTLVPQLANAISTNPVLTKVTSQLGPVSGTLGSLMTQVTQAVTPVTSQLPNVSLGEIAIGTPVRAINSDPAARTPGTPTPVGTASPSQGTTASGAFDLARISLAPSAGGNTATLANFYVGHLEATSNLTAPIECSLPVIKSADPTSVTAGQSFVYHIQVPDPAKLDLIDCNLDAVSITDRITDAQGTPSFSVTSATLTLPNGQAGPAGTIQTISPHEAIVTWTGLNYPIAATGKQPNPPIRPDITVAVPSNSTAGVIMDTVTATGTANDCQGGVAGTEDTSAQAANGTGLTGSFTLNQPSVAAAVVAPQTAAKKLPFTGAMGGLWQPLAGLGALAAGGGALALVRRARRISDD